MRHFANFARSLAAGGLAATILALSPLASIPAQALEFSCVEASRYKYLYRIFDNDPARFAGFFGVDPRLLPHPDTCRAVLVTGRVEAPSRDAADGENDFEKLMRFIADSRGWLATVYLASQGGHGATGLRMGFMTRLFWLKTHALDGRSFEYIPDFVGQGPGAPATAIPPGREAGWKAYLDATRGIRQVTLSNNERPRRCASACTFVHVAGIHRIGGAYFHRGRITPRRKKGDTSPPPEQSMSEILEGLQRHEARIVAFYREMDAGESAVRIRHQTATQTVRKASVPHMPRYIQDHVRTLCKIPMKEGGGEAEAEGEGTSDIAEDVPALRVGILHSIRTWSWM